MLRVIPEEELQLWLQYMTIGIQVHKLAAKEGAEFADACIEEFHSRRPAIKTVAQAPAGSH